MRIRQSFCAVIATALLLFASTSSAAASVSMGMETIPLSQTETHQWHAPLFLDQTSQMVTSPSWTGFSYPHTRRPGHDANVPNPSPMNHGPKGPDHFTAILGIPESSAASETPIPMAAWLLGAGIFGLIGFSRKP